MVGAPLAEILDWRICFASVIGSSHLRSGAGCQDFGGYELLDDSVLLLFAADGAGTAAHSFQGAKLVCGSFVEFFRARLEEGRSLDSLGEPECRQWVTSARADLTLLADQADHPVKEFACTFLGAILGEATSLFLQIGDGAIVVSCLEDPDAYDPVVWPEQAEYANMTFFVTADDAEDHLQVSKVDMPVVEAALFTDGLQRLALHMATKTAHDPFFRAMFGPLRLEPAGLSKNRCEWLEGFLGSAQVLARTDDDKTLVQATRMTRSETDGGTG